ncbi:hypothetical protein [Methyloversatilis universalis]|uniref:hypothetical protein n=1 Tax=Methyloversatilis universalis TaxID=378211 RepID=UPI0018DEE6DC|nr:hypothetical protein [Methyloversatilis universalis]
MKAQLREDYSGRDTTDLIELRTRDTLTDTAYEVLDEILKERGIEATAVEKAREDQQLQLERDAVESLPNIESAWRGMYRSFIVILVSVSVVLALGEGDKSPITISGGLAFAISTLFFWVKLWSLTKALGKDPVPWLLLVIFVPFLLGKVIAVYQMWGHVLRARKKANATVAA